MAGIPGGLPQETGSGTPMIAHLAKTYQTVLGKVQQQTGSPLEDMFLRVVKGNVEFVAREAGWKGRLQNFLARHNFGSYNVQRIAKALSTGASGEIPKGINFSKVAFAVSSIFDRLYPFSNSKRVQSAVGQIRSTVLQAAGKDEKGLKEDIEKEFKEIATVFDMSEKDQNDALLEPSAGENLSQFRTRLLENLFKKVKGNPSLVDLLLNSSKWPGFRPNQNNTLLQDLWQKIRFGGLGDLPKK